VENKLLGIGEVASASGLRPSALRYYEERGLIQATERKGGRRHYDPSVLRRLSFIALFQQVGFTVREIAELLGGGKAAKKWRSLAEAKVVELDAHLEQTKATKRLLEAVLECGCANPDGCELVTNAFERR
jgi:MerR family redox-sensitive transcriptional activator SoxR